MPTRRRLLPAVLGTFATVTALVVVTGSPAHADGPTTFTNNTSIAIPQTNQSSGVATANPYPSPITVSGMNGPVTAVTATLNGLSAGVANDIDLLLVAPDGSNLVLMSDAGGAEALTFAINDTITFSDSAGGGVPQSGRLNSGSYKPTDTDSEGPDTFPGPAPAPSADTTLAGAFTGTTANGDWKLFAVDDTADDTATIANGWSLTLTTQLTAVATSTTVTSTPDPSQVGNPVTIEATVTASGLPVTSGTVTFVADGTTNLGSDDVDLNGKASVAPDGLTEGSHVITATYGGSPGFLTSNGSTDQLVDRPTTIEAGRRFCNTGDITVPNSGPSTPYASRIFVSGVEGDLNSVRAGLFDVTHSGFGDLDVLLVAPGGQNVVLLSDAGGFQNVTNATLRFADGEPPVPTITSGSTGLYRPTDDDNEGADPFPAPAPAPSAATTLASLEASSPNGVWSLYVVDDAAGDAGSIGSWCVRLVAERSTSTALSVVPQSGPPASDRVLTATVSATGSPVSAGQVDFYATHEGVRTLLGSQAVTNGTAQLTTGTLEVGTSRVRAFYRGSTAGASNLTPSQSPNVPVAVRPTAEANGPYTINPGDSLTLSAAGSIPSDPADATFAWDVNGDGIYTDASGVSPTLTWAELQALGIQAQRSYNVRLRVTVDGLNDADATKLKVRAAPAQ